MGSVVEHKWLVTRSKVRLSESGALEAEAERAVASHRIQEPRSGNEDTFYINSKLTSSLKQHPSLFGASFSQESLRFACV